MTPQLTGAFPTLIFIYCLPSPHLSLFHYTRSKSTPARELFAITTARTDEVSTTTRVGSGIFDFRLPIGFIAQHQSKIGN
jgi:hypothetical protein